MVYQWKPGSRAKGSAQVAGEMCAELEANGNLTAANLVDVNRPVNAPLHDSFEWDDTIAGEEWRRHQARHIINSIVIVKAEEPKATNKVYYKIRSAEPHYESIVTILRDEDKYEALKQQAFEEFESYRKRYERVVELNSVFAAFDSIAR